MMRQPRAPEANTGLQLAAIALLAVASNAHAVDITVLRHRAVTAVVACIFALECPLGDLGQDGSISSADVLAAAQILQADPAAYTRFGVAGDPSTSGIFDPSLVFPSDDDHGWMAYSGVDYHEQGGFLTRDVTTRLASSTDGGMTWEARAAINPPAPMTVTVPTASLCGQPQCTGRMISEVPFLVDDATDPNQERRFKMFAHRYFIYPPASARGEDLQRALGSINLRTAPALAGPWSDDIPRLGWNLTPPEIDAAANANHLGAIMASCLALSEGGAVASADDLDFVFTCPYLSAGRVRQRVVQLRSHDHAATYVYIATLLDEEDAASIEAEGISAPSVFTAAGRTYLLVTPVVGAAASERYAGCLLLAFADRASGTLERDTEGAVIVRYVLPSEEGRFGGACSWDPRGRNGILMAQLFFDGTAPSFRLYDTNVGPAIPR